MPFGSRRVAATSGTAEAATFGILARDLHGDSRQSAERTRPYANPRPVTRDGVAAVLRAAWAGDPPSPPA